MTFTGRKVAKKKGLECKNVAKGKKKWECKKKRRKKDEKKESVSFGWMVL